MILEVISTICDMYHFIYCRLATKLAVKCYFIKKVIFHLKSRKVLKMRIVKNNLFKKIKYIFYNCYKNTDRT